MAETWNKIKIHSQLTFEVIWIVENDICLQFYLWLSVILYQIHIVLVYVKSIGDVRQCFIVKRYNIVQNEKLLFYFSIKIRCFVKCIVCTLLTYKFPSFSLMHFKHLLFNGNYLSVNFACRVEFVAKYMSVQKCNTSKRY